MATVADTLLSRSLDNVARAQGARRRGAARGLLDVLAEAARGRAQVALAPYRPSLDREPVAMADRRIGPGIFHR